MSLSFVKGDLFASDCQVLGVPVNTMGVMGAGLALAFANRNPGLLTDYKALCRAGAIDIGRCVLWKGRLLLVPTKRDWRNPSTLDYVEQGLEWISREGEGAGIRSLALPALGCGYGTLQFDQVRPLMVRHLQAIPFRVDVMVPDWKDL